ncbi:MAG: alkaline phosphatase family protein [Gemmatimonadetes bacterium]|nr:alkaline phosphatase family protein [Gemmatimonadota bacterium]
MTPAFARLAGAALLAVAAGAAVGAGGPATDPGQRLPAQGRSTPSLIVVFIVDQMRADYLERFRSQLTGGLRRLLQDGAVFTEAYQDHAMTMTAPGQATVLSGRNPYSTEIFRNAEGVQDGRAPLLEVRGPGASPRRFRGTSLFDWIAARDPAARALSVSRKDRSAILSLGRARQAVYWYQGGQFTTSRYYADSLPAWVRSFNARAVRARAPGRVWNPLLPASAYPEPDSVTFENGGRDVAFPHRLPDGGEAVHAFVRFPWMDWLTLAFALEGVERQGLGRGPGPDLALVSLAATDDIGHAFGPNSREIHDQILRLDRWLGMFLDSLGRLRDPRRMVVALTADHGVTPSPEDARAHGDRAARSVSFASEVRALRRALAERAGRAGPGDWVRYFEMGLLVMDRVGLEARGVNVDSVVEAFAARVRRSPAVLRVDTRRSLAARDTAVDWVARRWLNALPPLLPAELMVTLRPNMRWDGGGDAKHGQPTDADAHVPLILAGPGIRRGTYGARVSVADIAPTLAVLAGVPPLERVDGRVLREALTGREAVGAAARARRSATRER